MFWKLSTNTIVNLNDDLLSPRDGDLIHVEALSKATWQSLLTSAQYCTHFPPHCSDIKSMLHQTPAIPDNPSFAEIIVGKSMFLEGHATWIISPPKSSLSHNCDLPGTKKTSTRKLYIGECRPAVCSLSNDYFQEWPGLQPLTNPAGNYLALFVLGWSYVFSVRLIELRRASNEDTVRYTDKMAQTQPDHASIGGDELFDLDMRGDSAVEVRWWAAILAGGSGWHANLTRENKTHFSPWECHLDGNAFKITHNAGVPSSTSTREPPSRHLRRSFCRSLREGTMRLINLSLHWLLP